MWTPTVGRERVAERRRGEPSKAIPLEVSEPCRLGFKYTETFGSVASFSAALVDSAPTKETPQAMVERTPTRFAATSFECSSAIRTASRALMMRSTNYLQN